MKIAFVSGGSWGDNLNSTLSFLYLKNHWPDCEIDVYTSSRYYTPFVGNPYVRKIVQTECRGKNDSINLVNKIKPQGYDLVIANHPMFNRQWSCGTFPELGENLILSWISCLEKIGVPINSLPKTDLILSPQEIVRSREFFDNLPATKMGTVIVEGEGESGQSFWNSQWNKEVCTLLESLGYNVLLGGLNNKNLAKSITSGRIFSIADLSLRECSGVYDYCTGFISISSGLSNACNSSQRSLEPFWIEVVNSLACSSNVIRSEGKIFWHQNDLGMFLKFLETSLKDEE